MRNSTLFILLIVLVSSCISTKQRARKLVKKGYDTIQKGLDLDPSLADSIKGLTKVSIATPIDSGSQQINTAIDTTAFDSDIDNYDSLLLANEKLGNDISSGKLQGRQLENQLHNLSMINERLELLRSGFIKGYGIDSVYVYEDSTLSATFEIFEGQLKYFTYRTKADTVTAEVETNIVNLDGRKMVGNFWEDNKFWWFVGALILILLILSFRKIMN